MAKRLTALWMAALWPALSAALGLPDVAALQTMIGVPAAPVQVVEPHLSTRDMATRVQYRGWPAQAVLDRVLGDSWRSAGADVEFRALDGYVSRIPAERFSRFRAYLVYERIGQPDFTVDNLAQNEKNVPLGPYYLVWDNIRDPELLSEGGTYWPYQVAQLLVSRERATALLPPGIAPGFDESAALTQKYCLACHRVNGYGGDKARGDLAQITKALPRADFLRWVLEPSVIKPGTAMPGLPEAMAESDRQAVARRLLDYLVAVPSRQ